MADEGKGADSKAARAAIERLRRAPLSVLSAAMKQIVDNAYSNRATENTKLTAEQWALARALKFDELDGVIVEATYARHRPQVRLAKLGGAKYYCSAVAYHWKIKKYLHPDEKWTTKSDEWWEARYPLEYEVSHLYDGSRRDINPFNLTLEAHDLNKSRAFCRLLYEKNLREGGTVATAKTAAAACCAQLHTTACKYA
jgi:hypothetical protein